MTIRWWYWPFFFQMLDVYHIMLCVRTNDSDIRCFIVNILRPITMCSSSDSEVTLTVITIILCPNIWFSNRTDDNQLLTWLLLEFVWPISYALHFEWDPKAKHLKSVVANYYTIVLKKWTRLLNDEDIKPIWPSNNNYCY